IGFAAAVDYKVQESGVTMSGSMDNTPKVRYIGGLLRSERAIVDVYTTKVGQMHFPKNLGADKLLFSCPNVGLIATGATPVSVVDVRGCPKLDSLYTETASIDLSLNTVLRYAYFNNSAIANLDTSNNPLLVELFLYNCTLLQDVTLPASNENLTSISVTLSGLSKNTILEKIGNVWQDRTGKSAGVLRLSTSVYNSMSDDEKAVFTNKNINLLAQL
ncbi:hypothetical protein, partial [Dysgonomonas sp. 520]|uniref:hypothetical protein n=1 Tax=Dysgonomonas sp. 520 TaxID=2302931 RepID=UPI001C86BB44